MKRNNYNIQESDVIEEMIKHETRYWNWSRSTVNENGTWRFLTNEEKQQRLQKYIDYVKSTPRKEWTDNKYLSDYKTCRNALVEEKKRETIDTIMKFSGEAINEVLNKYGLRITRNNYAMTTDNGYALLKFVCENIVFPELEEKFNITGIRLRKNVSTASSNLFDFKYTEIK